jgi:anthranilate synthase component I
MNKLEMDLDQFREIAKTHNVIPVWRQFLADSETPLALYRKLAMNRPGTFLLESAEHGGAWSRYSFIGVNSEATLTEKSGVAAWTGTMPAGAPTGIDPLKALAQSASHLRSPKLSNLPPLTGGLVGYLGYEAVRRLEKLIPGVPTDLQIPEISFMLTSDLAVYDHQNGIVTLISNAINWNGNDDGVDAAFESAQLRLTKMASDLRQENPAHISNLITPVSPRFNRSTSDEQFFVGVERIKEEIKSGEAFQVVLSQRFDLKAEADAFDIYRILRLHNPSPYMYLLRFEDGLDIVGSSPEALVKVTNNEVLIHPIAGTRKRSSDPEVDAALGVELLADPKERAEHLMLVDLGRNDLGRVCEAGSVEVVEFMRIERYSHVMHIVSTVIGKLSTEKNSVDALFAVFPAGTLSGAPKPRAMQIIDENEPVRRGIYGGAIGYLDFTGNIDACIAIRTAVIKNGTAYVQAGAGIVADSDPSAENQECLNKAAAVLGAIATANEIKRIENQGGNI